MNTNSYPLD